MNSFINRIPKMFHIPLMIVLSLAVLPLGQMLYRYVRNTPFRKNIESIQQQYNLSTIQIDNLTNIAKTIDKEINGLFSSFGLGFIARDNDVIIKHLNKIGWDSEVDALIRIYESLTSKNLTYQLNDIFYWYHWDNVKITIRNKLKA